MSPNRDRPWCTFCIRRRQSQIHALNQLRIQCLVIRNNWLQVITGRYAEPADKIELNNGVWVLRKREFRRAREKPADNRRSITRHDHNRAFDRRKKSCNIEISRLAPFCEFPQTHRETDRVHRVAFFAPSEPFGNREQIANNRSAASFIIRIENLHCHRLEISPQTNIRSRIRIT